MDYKKIILIVASLLFSAYSYAEPLKIIALGDSYTIGESVSESQRWPNLLRKKLQKAGKPVAHVYYIAQTGWRSDQLFDAIQSDPNIKTQKADWVTVMIGVNDQFQGEDKQAFDYWLQKVLQQAQKIAGGTAKRVIVLSIPDWSVSKMGRGYRNQVKPEIQQFNAVVASRSSQLGMHYINLDKFIELAATDDTMLASDGLHFSGKMHLLWAKEVLNVIQNSQPTAQP